MNKLPQKLLSGLAFIALVAGAIRLLNAAHLDGGDLRVYWKAVQAWFSGLSPYAYTAEDQGFVFKYPPWLLPMLMPLRWMGFEFTKGFWATAELFTLGYCVRWLVRHQVSLRVALLSTFLYWYIWLGHFFSGQVTLFLLGTALWSMEGINQESSSRSSKQNLRTALLFVVFSTKVFSLYSLVGILRQWLRPKTLLLIGLLFIGLHGAVLGISSQKLSDLYQGWSLAASSGGAELGAKIVRGGGNHGFVAGILRWIDPEAQSLSLDILVFLILGLGLGLYWSRASRNLRFEEKWAGWLAYGVIIHPLAWHHSFVLTFPLAAFSLQAAVNSKIRSWIFLSALGIALTTLLVPQTVGPDGVKVPELLANKSWGVLLCSWVLLRARGSGDRKTVRTRTSHVVHHLDGRTEKRLPVSL